jgi:ParB family transcriptional regulator, chromosome partitioning protein
MVRQSGLGRGLGALLPSAEDSNDIAEVPSVTPAPIGVRAATTSAHLVDLPLSSVRPNALQPRTTFDEEALESLTDSVRTLGVLQPILVRPDGDGYELIAGERRWRAARRAGLPTIPAVIRTVENQNSLEQALVENLHRQDLNPLEEAAAFQQLIDDFRLTHEQVASRVGRSRASITNTLRLMQLSPAIQKLLLDGQLAAGHAKALLGSTDKSYQESLAKRAAGEGLSVRAVEEAVRLRQEIAGAKKAGTSAASGTIRADRSAAVVELEQLLSDHFSTRVQIQIGQKKGTVMIEFADENDLERLYGVILAGANGAPDLDSATLVDLPDADV